MKHRPQNVVLLVFATEMRFFLLKCSLQRELVTFSDFLYIEPNLVASGPLRVHIVPSIWDIHTSRDFIAEISIPWLGGDVEWGAEVGVRWLLGRSI